MILDNSWSKNLLKKNTKSKTIKYNFYLIPQKKKKKKKTVDKNRQLNKAIKHKKEYLIN